jgi:hypothetical protein
LDGQLVERREQPRQLLLGQAPAGVGDDRLEHQVVAGLARGQPHGDRAALGELDGVGQQVVEHLAQPHGIAGHPARKMGRALDPQAQALLVGVGPPQAQGVGHGLAQVERDLLDRHPPGVQARQVQQVVEQGAHHRAGVADQLGVDLGGGVGHVAVQAGGPGQDGADRRAQLVADHGHEGRLGGDGLLGLVAAALGLVLGRGLGPQGPLQGAGGHEHRDDQQQHPEPQGVGQGRVGLAARATNGAISR